MKPCTASRTKAPTTANVPARRGKARRAAVDMACLRYRRHAWPPRRCVGRNNQVTSLTYSGGKLTSITDPANRTATLAYTGNQLASIADPGNDVWQYTYDSANHLTALTDPNIHTTTFTYNFAGRVASVTRADNTTEQLTAEQMNGLAAPGTGTSGNPAAAVLLAAGDQARFTDPNNQVWLTNLDWLSFGLAVLAADPLGDTALVYRDANGLPWLSADPLARRTREFFDNKGNPTEIVQPDDSFAQYQYNNFSEVTQSTDPTGAITSYSYNAKGGLTQLTDAMLHPTTYAYNTAGLLTSTTDPLGHLTSYTYNALNELTGVTNALNQSTTYAYNTAGLVTSTTDARGFTNTFAYDALNRLTGKTLADSSTTNSVYAYSYDSVGNQLSATDPLNHITSFSYDKLNRLSGVTDALNETTTYGYDAAGNLTGITNPLNQMTSFDYDAADRLTSITNALNQMTSFGYDAAGQKTSITNALNQTTTYGYTVLGQVASITDPLGDVLSYSYNAVGDGLTVSQTGPGQHTFTTSMAYNALHQLTSSTDPLNNTTTYGYDAIGNQTSVTDPLGHLTSYTYNALNQLIGATDALNHQTTFGYDADGNQTSITDPLGRLTTMSYDAQGRLLSSTDPLLGTTSYAYNLAGLLTSLTDVVGNQTTYSYDAVNRLTSTTDPLGHPTTYAYNAAGEMTSETDRDGRVRNFGYDAAGRETSETWVGGNYTATYAYNAAGELTNASDPFSVYNYGYNAAAQLTSVDNQGTPGVPHVLLSYGYDVFGNRISMRDSLGGLLSYGYDGHHRLSSITATGSGPPAIIGFTYDAASRLTQMNRSASGDNFSTSFSYDNANRLTNITHTDTTKALTLANYTYGYDAASQLTSYQDSNSLLTYGYDADGQLTSAAGTLNGSSYGVSYSYDKNGNRTMPGYATSTGNRLTSDGVYNYTYDNEGNTLTQTNISTGSVTYFTWDFRNRLTEVQVKDSGGHLLQDEKFTYDVNDNRIGVSLNGVQQLYTVYDGANPYMDFNGAGTLTQRYLANPNGLSQFYGQVSASGVTQWFLTDNIGSIRQVVSTSSTSLDALTYDPYGQLVSQTNSANAPRMMYAGGTYDSISGNNQFGLREERPSDGKFTSEDPSGFTAGDADLFRYVFNAPTGIVDPSGLSGWPSNMSWGQIGQMINPFGGTFGLGSFGGSSSSRSMSSGEVGMGGLLSSMYGGGGSPNISPVSGSGNSLGGGMTTNLFGAIPNNGTAGQDLIAQVEANMVARARMEAMGLAPPPMTWGTSVPAYGSNGSQTFAGAMVQAGQQTIIMTQYALAPFEYIPGVGDVASVISSLGNVIIAQGLPPQPQQGGGPWWSLPGAAGGGLTGGLSGAYMGGRLGGSKGRVVGGILGLVLGAAGGGTAAGKPLHGVVQDPSDGLQFTAGAGVGIPIGLASGYWGGRKFRPPPSRGQAPPLDVQDVLDWYEFLNWLRDWNK